jgi:hypothetical protein
MTFIVDIDDTIIKSLIENCKECGYIRYKNAKPIQDEIDEINKKFKEGHIIILHTGRGWNQYELTKKQLKECRVKYTELIMGKPTGIYVDRDAIKSIKDFDKNIN